MPNPIPPSAQLIPSPQELRLRLAVALREVDLLRGMIRLSERASRFDRLPDSNRQGNSREETRCST
jgi:hypothetical protein